MKIKNISIKHIFIIILTLLILGYIGYITYMLINNSNNICVVKNGAVYEEESSIGYIIRDEKVIQSENEIIPIIQEGEKVAKDASIFKFLNSDENDINEKINDITYQIQEKINEDGKISTADTDLIDENVGERVVKLKNTNNYKELLEIKDEINNELSFKLDIFEKSDEISKEIKELIREKKEYENEKKKNSENIKSNISGIVSYRVDGLEEELMKEKINNIDLEYLNSLKIRTNEIIATSKKSGKVVNNFEGYIVTVLQSEEAKNAKVGDKVRLRLYTNDEINAKIDYINNLDENNILISFKLNSIEKELTRYRKVSFNIIWWSEEGLRIPNNAIYENEKGLNYVLKNRSGYINEALVKVIVKNEDYSLVTSYDQEELTNLNLTEEEIKNNQKIKLYDEVVIKKEK